MTHRSDLDQARQQLDEGQFRRAFELYSLTFMGTDEPSSRREAAAGAGYCCVRLGHVHEALAWADDLRDVAPASGEPDVIEAAAHLSLGNAERCLELLADIDRTDAAQWHHPASIVDHLRCLASVHVEDDDAALIAGAAALRSDPLLPEVWTAVADIAARTPLDLSAVLDAVHDDDLLEVLSYLVETDVAGADRILEGFWQRSPEDLRPLTVVAIIGSRLGLSRAVEWSTRLREAGLAQQCAVLGRAANEDLEPGSRVEAAAVASRLFDDPRAADLLIVAARLVHDDEVSVLFEKLVELDLQELLDEFVIAVASTPLRSLLLARSLFALGSVDAAVSLAQHASELATGQPDVWNESLSGAMDGAQRLALAAAAAQRGASSVAEALRP